MKKPKRSTTWKSRPTARLPPEPPDLPWRSCKNVWLTEQTVVKKWQDALQARAQGLDNDLANVRTIQELWQLTLDSAGGQALPVAILDTVRATLNTAADTGRRVSARRDQVLTLQIEVSRLATQVSDGLIPIRDGIKAQSRSVLIPNQPPIWKTPWQQDGNETVAERIRQARRDDLQSISDYASTHIGRVANHVFGFLVLLIGFRMLGRRASVSAEQDASLQATARLLRRPVATSVLISTLVQEWFHPQAPSAWSDALTLLLLVALCRLLPAILPSRLRPGLVLLVVLFLIEQLAILVPQEALLYRLVMLVLALATAASLAWVVHRVGDPQRSRYPRWIRAATAASKVGIGMLLVAALADVIGSVDLAGILIQGVLVCTYFGLLLWTGTLVLSGTVAVVLRTGFANRFNMIRSHRKLIMSNAVNAINLIAVAVWIGAALHGFGLRLEAAELIEKVVAAEITLFGKTFHPFMVIPVLFAVWLTFTISKLVNFVLENDVLEKVSLPRGMANTILKSTRYVILTIGFFVIVSMLGLDLTKFTIIAGALSVGVGFGMQNIVNNFVSGLILLFERPIKEGDKIEIGSISGEVKRIGTRASIVKTWQGAEVIVPNADLISKELTNWTLFDMRRRIEIPVGVAYGSDPEAVLSTLLAVAQNHPDVLDDPAPTSLFLGFGDSALNFELRAWTLADFVRVRSELVVTMSRALTDAGFEIPFPQRDLHLKTEFPKQPASMAEAGRDDRPEDQGEVG